MDDAAFATAGLRPVDRFGISQLQDFGHAVTVALEAFAHAFDFIPAGTFLKALLAAGEPVHEFPEGKVDRVLKPVRFPEAKRPSGAKKGVPDLVEKVGGAFLDLLDDETEVIGAEGREKSPALTMAKMKQFLKLTPQPLLADPLAEVIGGDRGQHMRFVENEEILREENTGDARLRGLAGGKKGKEQAVVDDDEVGPTDGGAGATEGAGIGCAVSLVAGMGVGMDPFPDLRRRRRLQFLAQAGGGVFGPVRDPLQFLLLGGREEFGARFQRLAQARSAEVIGPTEKDGMPESGAILQGGVGGKEFPAERKVLGFDLLLEGDGMGGDKERTARADGVEQPRNQVGEGFADARAGLRKKRPILRHGTGRTPCHIRLLGTELEAEMLLKKAALGKDPFDLRRDVEARLPGTGPRIHGLI